MLQIFSNQQIKFYVTDHIDLESRLSGSHTLLSKQLQATFVFLKHYIPEITHV